jgi:hypothetical protein
VKRREFIAALASAAVAWPIAAQAQQAAIPMIGFLDPRSPDALADLRALPDNGLGYGVLRYLKQTAANLEGVAARTWLEMGVAQSR